MVKTVDLPIRSPRNAQAMMAVKKGMELRVKVVAATVVLVIACKKEMLAQAKKKAAITPCNPTPLIFWGAVLPYRKSKTNDTASANAIDL